jgi:Na+/phosphate symporter
MDPNIIIDIVVVAVIVGSYLIGKYITPTLSDNTKTELENAANELSIIVTYADKFVVWAREFMKESKGTEKMDEVISKLKEIADKYSIDMTEDQLKAIAQTAYENMMGTNSNDITSIVEQAIEPLKINTVSTTTEYGDNVELLGNDTKIVTD